MKAAFNAEDVVNRELGLSTVEFIFYHKSMLSRFICHTESLILSFMNQRPHHDDRSAVVSLLRPKNCCRLSFEIFVVNFCVPTCDRVSPAVPVEVLTVWCLLDEVHLWNSITRVTCKISWKYSSWCLDSYSGTPEKTSCASF
jgi:hypothetical protein